MESLECDMSRIPFETGCESRRQNYYFSGAEIQLYETCLSQTIMLRIIYLLFVLQFSPIEARFYNFNDFGQYIADGVEHTINTVRRRFSSKTHFGNIPQPTLNIPSR